MHRDIVHLDGGNAPGAIERRNGYRTAMADHGLSTHVRVLSGDYTEQSGAAAARELLAEKALPTAVIAGNDQSAAGLLDTLRSNGIGVPGEISIVGYDDSRLARLAHVNLTTVRQDVELLARHAVEAAVDRVPTHGQPDAAQVFKLAPHLVIRGSTGPVRP